MLEERLQAARSNAGFLDKRIVGLEVKLLGYESAEVDDLCGITGCADAARR
jgi:hypothetical protein